MLPLSIAFLSALQDNNNKAWFDMHKADYQAARQEFTDFCTVLLAKIAVFNQDVQSLEAKNCIFRINRDVRFSANKAPYKNNFGVYFAKGGKKSKYAGFYLHVEPQNAFMGGGLWMPQPTELAQVRQEIDYNGARLADVLDNPSFKKFYQGFDSADAVKSAPKGYDKNHPYIEWLKLKSFVVLCPLSKEELVANTLLEKATAAAKALKPLSDFLNSAIE